MPRALQFATYLVPVRYFLVIIRGIFLKGIGFNEVYREVLALALIGITIFIITLSRFKKNLG